ncbi:hypothetical protein JQC91_07360 [Jannaschia sp. Os4]|uniref:hypothetical protein n=1 Tax=Jannaschia sp. Os4 TaxID=2807617 RepID=UPI0019399A6A|nr:hypothetical protein [Jannaschia sp. Os4]MBM2576119.1 hypothetical protein [Jannaschia sp. Os4]
MIQPDLLHLSFYYGPPSMVHRFIRMWSNSRVSHVEIVRPGDRPGDGARCECIAATIAEGFEVRRREVRFEPGQWFHVAVEWVDPEEAWARALAETDKGYDLRGLILSHMFNARRETPGKWFCSELAAHAAKLGSPQDYSPGQLLLRVRERNAAWRAAKAGQRFMGGPAVTPFGTGEMPMSSAPPPPAPPRPRPAPPRAPAPPPEGGGSLLSRLRGRVGAPLPRPVDILAHRLPLPGAIDAPPELPVEATQPIDVPADPGSAESLYRRLSDAPPGEGAAS